MYGNGKDLDRGSLAVKINMHDLFARRDTKKLIFSVYTQFSVRFYSI